MNQVPGRSRVTHLDPARNSNHERLGQGRLRLAKSPQASHWVGSMIATQRLLLQRLPATLRKLMARQGQDLDGLEAVTLSICMRG